MSNSDEQIRENIKIMLDNVKSTNYIVMLSLFQLPEEVADWAKENIKFTSAVGRAEVIIVKKLTKPYLVMFNESWLAETNIDRKCRVVLHEVAHCYLGHDAESNVEDIFKMEKEAEEQVTKWLGVRRKELLGKFSEEKGFMKI